MMVVTEWNRGSTWERVCYIQAASEAEARTLLGLPESDGKNPKYYTFESIGSLIEGDELNVWYSTSAEDEPFTRLARV